MSRATLSGIAVVLSLNIGLLSVAACSGGTNKSAARPTTTVVTPRITVMPDKAAAAAAVRSPVKLDEKPSAIHGVPVPASAVLDAADSHTGTETYRFDPRALGGTIEAFYAKKMPAGFPFAGFSWCTPRPVAPGSDVAAGSPGQPTAHQMPGVELSWHEPGVNNYLLVEAFQEGRIVIVDDRNEPRPRPCR